MNKTRILVDLKPAFDGFAGIPQETRLLFTVRLPYTACSKATSVDAGRPGSRRIDRVSVVREPSDLSLHQGSACALVATDCESVFAVVDWCALTAPAIALRQSLASRLSISVKATVAPSSRATT